MAGKRLLKIAGMTASIATKTVSNKIKSFTGNDEQKQQANHELFQQIGTQIAETLGEMKGAAMKVGQIASQYKDIFPPEVSKAIAKLQREAPPVEFKIIQQQVEKELKCPLNDIFSHFEPIPFASASIGQVHKAILKDGRNVVVKVQYPQVDEACKSDLKYIRIALRLMGVLKIDKQLQDKLFAEIEESLIAELNYEIEAHNLQLFRTFHQNIDPKVIIPEVLTEYSSHRVLTLSEELGENIQTASTWTQEKRNELGRRLLNAINDEIFVMQRFHCDPHPGNFAFREDGSVIIYDFGAVKSLEDSTIASFKRVLNAGNNHDIPRLEQELMELQCLTQAGQFPQDLYEQWIEILLRPLRQKYDFAENSSHHDAVELMKSSLKYWDLFKPSPYTLLINRTISGHYWNLIQLKVDDDLSDFFKRSLQ
ncbi:AarF/ABC1/UbiB kinase family protein [Moraxella sp. ZY210820]|uniref:ABC1 kinase family protein n=1 Tax=unclassified Moraxella TaxID=2685852 RepID=UPI00272EEC1B|nr:AarF/ABC1/UbiB kinase family protein [Moraxella sp. ZY210820]WLF84294.1 AarF/ABC1/UbiB kinase family protein [Moraxella sp. ZY210820]